MGADGIPIFAPTVRISTSWIPAYLAAGGCQESLRIHSQSRYSKIALSPVASDSDRCSVANRSSVGVFVRDDGLLVTVGIDCSSDRREVAEDVLHPHRVYVQPMVLACPGWPDSVRGAQRSDTHSSPVLAPTIRPGVSLCSTSLLPLA